MTDLRYKAFISYSHSDERWAAWLHRHIESYRIPRKLVGTRTEAGIVPARIRPVFRDRDDLTSSSDLSINIRQALAESENLIVVCSPDSAISKWVNEEIREFARLGRADRIFCIIVGGDSPDCGSVADCFPPALAEINIQEPLASDMRKWADGKRVAGLKLIAGLLGIRLDELRQRDLQRRRKRQLFTGLGMTAVLALAVMTVVSQISERQEREKAEQLATFIVDLGEKLQSETDLETLAMISAASSRHLQGLDPDKLSPETGKKVALALRQMARVSRLQGRPDEALHDLQRSRAILSELNDKHPASQDLIFELGMAEYSISALHYKQGQFDLAVKPMQSYHRLTLMLVDIDPENPDWIMELAYSHNNLAALRLDSGKGINAEMLVHVAEATRLMEAVVALRPDDETVADGYSTILAWAAAAQYQACSLENAMNMRNKARELAESTSRADPGNYDLKRRYAFTLTGVARAQIVTGKLVSAEENLVNAINVLRELSAADPSNVDYVEDVRNRRRILAGLWGDTGRLQEAYSELQKLELEYGVAGENLDQAGITQRDYIHFLLDYADVESQLGEVLSARRHLEAAIQMQPASPDLQAKDIFDTQVLVKTRYQWWELNGVDSIDGLPTLPKMDEAPASEFRSCLEADSAARLYVMANEKVNAAREVDYLQSRGYADPDFVRFCENHQLCED